MSHVFISYIHDNENEVQRLCNDLTMYGVKVWLDRNDIEPGTRWQLAIRRAIQEGAFFIACFSKEYNERAETYMNEELTLAIERLRKLPQDRAWFIPVKLNECKIPDRDIGAGETLQDIQWVDMFPSWEDGVQRILSVLTSVERKEASFQEESSPRELFFGLGNHIALLSWVKATKDNKDQLSSIYNKALFIMELLQFPSSAVSEFKAFSQSKSGIDRQGNTQATVLTMLSLRDTFATTIRYKFGVKAEKAFFFGFVLTNIVYMCEQPHIVSNYKDFVEENLSTLVENADDLGLATDTLEDLIAMCRTAETKEEFSELYSEVCKSVTIYEDALQRKQ